VPSPQAVEAVFNLPRPEGNLAQYGKVAIGGRYLVFEVRAVHDADLGQVTPEERQQLRAQLSAAGGFDAQKAYVAGERTRYKIEVAEDRL
jgi:peptidyl-prolyl cis-trans isomerase D